MKLKNCLLVNSCIILLLVSCSKQDENSQSVYNNKTTALFQNSKQYGTVTDADGNEYKTIQIGNQVWMAENLRTTVYNDGSQITHKTDTKEWSELSNGEIGGYCNYNNTTNIDTIATFGRLYNWYTIKTNKICPEGWHVPSDSEWTELETFVGPDSVASNKLQEQGFAHWIIPHENATNEFGFTALPAGYRNSFAWMYSNEPSSYNDSYYSMNEVGVWWTSTEYETLYAYQRAMHFNSSYVGRNDMAKSYGLSIRCIKN